MKVTLNLRDYLLDAADGDHMLTATTSFSVDELFDGNAIEEECEIDVDLDELLAENHQIAHVWGVEDVQQLRPDLDDDRAWQVLQAVAKGLNSEWGICWQTIEITADKLYGPEPARHWRGRIDVTIEDTDGYGQDEALTRFRDMAALLAKDMPDVKATVDEQSVQLVNPGRTDEAEEQQP
jgi:hypothetical protein